MWKILRAELSYYRYWLLAAFCWHCIVLSVFTIITVKQGAIEYKALPVITFMMAIITYFVLVFVMLSREKRRRMHSLLPLSAFDIGLSRVLFVFLFWAVLVLVFGLNLLMVKLDTLEVNHTTFESNLLLDILAINGFLLILNAKYLLSRDMGYWIRRRFTIFNISNDHIPAVLMLLLLAPVIGFLTVVQISPVEPLRTVVLSTAVSPAGTFALNAAGIILSFLSISIFIKRRSYLS